MVGTATDVDNVLEVGVDNRRVLYFNIRVREETEDAVIFLSKEVISPTANIRLGISEKCLL